MTGDATFDSDAHSLVVGEVQRLERPQEPILLDGVR